MKAQIIQDELRCVDQGLAEARRRVGELTILAGADGIFVAPAPSSLARSACPCSPELTGRFLKDGELIGYVVELGTVVVRAVVRQEDIERISHDTTAVRSGWPSGSTSGSRHGFVAWCPRPPTAFPVPRWAPRAAAGY